MRDIEGRLPVHPDNHCIVKYIDTMSGKEKVWIALVFALDGKSVEMVCWSKEYQNIYKQKRIAHSAVVSDMFKKHGEELMNSFLKKQETEIAKIILTSSL